VANTFLLIILTSDGVYRCLLANTEITSRYIVGVVDTYCLCFLWSIFLIQKWIMCTNTYQSVLNKFQYIWWDYCY